MTLAAASGNGPWFLALDHSGVVAKLGDAPVDMPGPGLARFAYPMTTALHRALSRVFDLAIALPDDPLRRFEAEIRKPLQQTEAARMVAQRIGQDRFRDALVRFLRGRPHGYYRTRAVARQLHEAVIRVRDEPGAAGRLSGRL